MSDVDDWYSYHHTVYHVTDAKWYDGENMLQLCVLCVRQTVIRCMFKVSAIIVVMLLALIDSLHTVLPVGPKKSSCKSAFG